MCREMSKEGYRVVSLASSPCRTNFYGGECRTFFRRRKKMFRAENLKRYKGKSSDCGTQSGFFCFIPFLQTVLHSASPSSREIPGILCSAEIVQFCRERCPRSVWQRGAPQKVGEGDVCVVRCAKNNYNFKVIKHITKSN